MISRRATQAALEMTACQTSFAGANAPAIPLQRRSSPSLINNASTDINDYLMSRRSGYSVTFLRRDISLASGVYHAYHRRLQPPMQGGGRS